MTELLAAASSPSGAAAYLGIHLAVGGLWLTLGHGRVPAWVSGFVLLAISVNAAGWGLGLLDSVPRYDVLAHGLCSFAATAAIAAVLARKGMQTPRALSFAMAAALLGGLAWEAHEWYLDRHVIHAFTMTPQDTLGDLVANVLGVVSAVFFASARLGSRAAP